MFNAVKSFLLFTIVAFAVGCSPKVYEDYFSENRMRFDYEISGNATDQKIMPINCSEERTWGGSRINLIDTFEYGEYMLKIFDKKSEKLIYSRGFSDLFVEWQTTNEAKSSEKAYKQTLLFPFPKQTVKLGLYKRNSKLQFEELFTQNIDPDTIFTSPKNEVETSSKMIHQSGDSRTKLDIVMLSEGYTEAEKEKFYKDAERFKNYLFGWKPYDKYVKDININAVFAPSKESGVDIDGEDIWKNTLLDAHFYTFGIERYLTLPDLTKVYNCLSDYPVDQVVVLVNSDKYGGGGIYNFYNIFTSDNESAELLFLHEFGHGFAGLADEYFNTEVAYETTSLNSPEPYQPNITNLIDFKSKWKALISDTVPIPTPDIEKYDSILGVYEGANYLPKGFYRPYRTCAMRSSKTYWFCPVCKINIGYMVEFYAK